MSRTFLQADFGTVKGVSMAASGCGPTAIADIVYNVDDDIKPDDVARWLISNGYMSEDGTTRTGVTAALKRFGMQSLYATPEHTGNAEWKLFFDLIKTTHTNACWAIVLAVGKKNGGQSDKWTRGGHYMAITDYDPKTGWIYVRDPAGRNTGYHDPRTLQYCTNAMWFICKQY